ncbi:Venom serine carboxypeptidase [Orchesella cincta]|uniref:Venom serine carboxypeptidase n=1 Tax=Orchesella cincta TaxID=48709 RepID=A0A1D2MFX5_ORCCI|nr:Venom serine carboxypeptidase [Orchesella cincta]
MNRDFSKTPSRRENFQLSQTNPYIQCSTGKAGPSQFIERDEPKSCISRYLLYIVTFTVTGLFLTVLVSLKVTADEFKNLPTPSKNLILTPLINAGNISEAKSLANVTLFPGVTSYSGFLTVDEECKSHLFFWFFPAATGNKSAPLVLWHGGTGPVILDKTDDSWTLNNNSWTQSRSVLYLDSPVGAGFSYTEKGGLCYAFSRDDVADGTINALRQFFELFPEYVSNDLYISSSSYGGKFLPVIAWRIDNDNQLDKVSGDVTLKPINLKGIISMSGFSDPLHQIDYGEFYYNMGFIDKPQLKYFKAQESLAKAYIRSKNVVEAYKIIDPLILGYTDGRPSYLKNITGIKHPSNFMEDLVDSNIDKYLHRHDTFLNLPWVQESIHVDTASSGRVFQTSSRVVYENLLSDLYKSVGDLVENLLDAGYKFLFTSGQFDLVVPHTTIEKFLDELRWKGTNELRSKGNSWWKYNGQVVGYGKIVGNLTYLMFRNVGHHPFVDQPEWTLDLILRFTN